MTNVTAVKPRQGRQNVAHGASRGLRDASLVITSDFAWQPRQGRKNLSPLRGFNTYATDMAPMRAVPRLAPWATFLRPFGAVLAVTVLVMGCSLAQAQEQIVNFDSDITIKPDGSMEVRETIAVVALGEQIKRGIYRDFPTRYKDRLGNRYTVPFEVVEVLRDGKPEPHHTEKIANGVRLYIGDKDVMLERGPYRYTIVYRTNRQLGFFKDHDELYWNVTGNGWAFTIGRATARVRLPGEVARGKINLEAYTGAQGEQGKDFDAFIDDDGRPTFATKKELPPTHGLTIVVSFPKGLVPEPTTQQVMQWFLADNISLLIGVLGIVLVSVYYFTAWVMVGKDPESGTIVPLFNPPDNLSPAAMRYLDRMGYDRQCLTAALIHLAVKGHVRIKEQKDGDYIVARAHAFDDNDSKLPPDERRVANELLGSRQTLKLEKSNHSIFSRAITGLKDALSIQFEKQYFLLNQKYLIPGLILSVITVAIAGVLSPSFVAGAAMGGIFMCVWLTGWSFGVVMLLIQVFTHWRDALAGRGGVARWGAAIFITLFSLPFVAGEVMGLYFLTQFVSAWVPVIAAILGIIGLIFHELIKAPTRNGQKLMDQIDGFKMYLKTAEKDRLNFLNPPERTPALFEKYLPYALALGVENEWAQQFSEVLAKASQSPSDSSNSHYHPMWYSGRSWSTLGAAGFSSALGSSLSGAIASASTAPGSSSGSSGGGSSGGGGGGGGGGGW